jgi:peptidoglycan/xylan/chitin deacetylase (PgdA/CDA1 family)
MRLDRFITLNLVQPFHRQERQPLSPAFPCPLPILMYHSISEDDESRAHPYYRTCTNPARFAEQMSWLKQNGWRGVTLETGLHSLNTAGTSMGKQRPVAITFDDGFRNFHTDAFPVLQEHGFSATMFLPTAFIGESRRSFRPGQKSRASTLRPRISSARECLTWNEVRELHAAGIEFGSHTVTHPKLVDLSWTAIELETRNSKHEIEARLGASIRAFAYPYAFPQADPQFAASFVNLLRFTGYASCATTEVGRARAGGDRYRLKRLPVNSADDPELFQAKLSGGYDWLALPQAWMKRIKTATDHIRRPRGESSEVERQLQSDTSL